MHIFGIKEMPAGFDAEVALLFRDLRGATNLSLEDLAARLGTHPTVIQALEEGAVYALPPWPETARVIDSYGLLLGLDVGPLLRRIQAQLGAEMAEPPARAPRAAVPRKDYPAAAPHGGETSRPIQAPQGFGPAAGRPQQPQPQEPSWGLAPQQSGRQTAPGAQPSPQRRQPEAPRTMTEWTAGEAEERAPKAQKRKLQAGTAPPKAKTRAGGPLLLKWGAGVLAVGGVILGLWFVLGSSRDETGSGTSGSQGSKPAQEAPADPADPQSRKTDRLPGPL